MEAAGKGISSRSKSGDRGTGERWRASIEKSAEKHGGHEQGLPRSREGDMVLAEERRYPRSIWRMIFGWVCLAVGILGVVLPIIPGVPFLVLGIVTLASQHRWARKVMMWAKRRWSHL